MAFRVRIRINDRDRDRAMVGGRVRAWIRERDRAGGKSKVANRYMTWTSIGVGLRACTIIGIMGHDPR